MLIVCTIGSVDDIGSSALFDTPGSSISALSSRLPPVPVLAVASIVKASKNVRVASISIEAAKDRHKTRRFDKILVVIVVRHDTRKRKRERNVSVWEKRVLPDG